MNKMTIVFDVDDVLASHEKVADTTKLFFLRKGFIIVAADRTHFVPPGVKESMQLLFAMENVKVAFFSSGDRARVEELIHKLLISSLGDEHYNQIKGHLIILSRDDCEKEDETRSKKQCKQYGLRQSKKKDISKAVLEGNLISDAILIDDNSGHVYYGQEGNLICSRAIESDAFDLLSEEMADYRDDDDGESAESDTFQKVNGFYYNMGVILDCIEHRDSQPIRAKLFDLQFKRNPLGGNFDYKPCFNKTHKTQLYYDNGLSALQTINSELCFNTPLTFKECIEAPISESEQKMVDEANLDTVNTGCLVM